MSKTTGITWRMEERNVKDLVPADYNPRKISAKEREDLQASVEEFGQVVPVAVNIGKRKDIIIGGHQRITIYADLGMPKVGVMVPSRELTLEEEKKLNLRLNKNVASWDQEKLFTMDVGLLLEVGFGDEELAEMWNNVDLLDDGFNAAKKAKEIKKIRVKTGEVWQLGRHRLMCGDSTKKSDTEKLMGGEKADMVYSDPPTNIKECVAGNKEQGTFQARLDADAYLTFLEHVISNAKHVTKENAHIFYWASQQYIWAFQMLYYHFGIISRRVALWIKSGVELTPNVAFNTCYESCVYGTKGKAPYLNKKIRTLTEIQNKHMQGGNQVYDEILSQIDLWLQTKDMASAFENPNEKPISLHEKPLKRCTAPGDIVLDQFCAGGSTLVACEQLGRTCYAMEADPVYATVAIERFEELTGAKAKKILD